MAERVFVIAEAGVNHNGDVSTALELIEVAAECGADAVKFQTFRADSLVTRSVGRAEYQTRNLGSDGSQSEMLRALELPEAAYGLLTRRADELGIEFMSTAFDEASLEFLVAQVGIHRIKVPSGELTNIPFLLSCARRGLPLIMSTGMATMSEVRMAMDALAYGLTHVQEPHGLDDLMGSAGTPSGQETLSRSLVLLQCTSDYPTAAGDVNLRAMLTMGAEFGVPVGFSDHSQGIHMAVAATAMGASVLEKHFTLSRDQVGPDHFASLEPGELSEMIRSVRDVSAGLGHGLKEPTDAERRVAPLVRKVLVAGRPVRKGEVFGPTDVVTKRAGEGLTPDRYWDVVGSIADADYEVDDVLRWSPQ